MQTRTKLGRYSHKAMAFADKFVIGVLAVGVVVGAVNMTTTAVYTNNVFQTVEAAEFNSPDKIAAAKWAVVDELEMCEGGGKWDDGLIVLDTNDLRSYGSLQFQRATVQHYAKTLWGEELNGREAVILALTEEDARQLAYDIIWTTERGMENWHNCAEKHGLYGKVELLKELSS